MQKRYIHRLPPDDCRGVETAHAETVTSHLWRQFGRILAAGLLASSTLLAAPLAAPLAALLAAPRDSAATAPPATSPATLSAARWVWPIDAPRVIARGFIAPETPYASGHRGIDLWSEPGSPVYAPESGVVHFVGVVVDRSVISIEHAGGLITSFEPVSSPLAPGTLVHRGEQIGSLQPTKAGAPQSGHCGASCLHFGVRLHGQYVSPLNYLGGIPHSILLPTREIR